MLALRNEGGLEGQSSQSPSSPPCFSSFSVSAFSSLSSFCSAGHQTRICLRSPALAASLASNSFRMRIYEKTRGWGPSARLLTAATGCLPLATSPMSFLLFAQRVNSRRTATSVTPFPSCVYFTTPVIPGGWPQPITDPAFVPQNFQREILRIPANKNAPHPSSPLAIAMRCSAAQESLWNCGRADTCS